MKNDRILIIHPYGIGDAIFCLPLMEALKNKNGVNRLDVVIGSRTADVFNHCPHVNKTFVIDKDRWKALGPWKSLKEKISLLRILFSNHYTVLIDISMQPEYAFWAFLLGIPLRVGFNYKNRNPFLNKPLNIPPEGFSGKNMIEYYADLGRLLGIEIQNKQPELSAPEKNIVEAENLLQSCGIHPAKYILLSPGGGISWGNGARLRIWPAEYFIKLLNLFFGKVPFEGVVIIGAGEDRPAGELIKAGLSGKVLNCCGEVGLMTSAALIKMSRCFIGSDSGIVHLASTQKVPIVTFYGAPDPIVYGPYPPQPCVAVFTRNLPCRPCYRKFRYNDNCSAVACLLDLTPENIFAELEKRDFFKNIA